MAQTDTINLLVALVPLVGIVIGLSQIILAMSKGSQAKRESLLDMIEKLKIDLGDIRSTVSRLEADNAELKKDNDELRRSNLEWRKIARKWYLTATSLNKDLRELVEPELEEPTDL